MSSQPNSGQEKSSEHQRFDELASKLFKVPASEARELIQKEKQAKKRQDESSTKP